MAEPKAVTDNVLSLIGNTPLVPLKRVTEPGSAELYVKLELLNPAKTVKDRTAWSMINVAEKSGTLRPGMTIVEATSGNTGIALAMVAAAKGYRLILTMPDTMSQERRDLLRSYGAELVLTQGVLDMQGAVDRAKEICDATPHATFTPQQFDNPANPQVHRETTGPEILDACEGRVDAFVSGVGTGGTVTGAGEAIRDACPDALIVAVEPARSNVLSGGSQGLHDIQGIGAGFVPPVLDRGIYDEVVCVEDEEAIAAARRLSREEGILAGISAGANVHVSIQVASRLGEGKRVVTVICDSGERYFSLPGFIDSDS
ncbi:MAG TPA: cysteine synthase A [Candidatus Latescibacteria bacterium]|nr:cysteine synthase A [Candidatus Latescibacterota bacterium]